MTTEACVRSADGSTCETHRAPWSISASVCEVAANQRLRDTESRVRAIPAPRRTSRVDSVWLMHYFRDHDLEVSVANGDGTFHAADFVVFEQLAEAIGER